MTNLPEDVERQLDGYKPQMEFLTGEQVMTLMGREPDPNSPFPVPERVVLFRDPLEVEFLLVVEPDGDLNFSLLDPMADQLPSMGKELAGKLGRVLHYYSVHGCLPKCLP